jgi:hypothetical protein
MGTLFELILCVIEGVGGFFGRRRPMTPEEVERQRILKRKERAWTLFVIFGLVLCAFLLLARIFRWDI